MPAGGHRADVTTRRGFASSDIELTAKVQQRRRLCPANTCVDGMSRTGRGEVKVLRKMQSYLHQATEADRADEGVSTRSAYCQRHQHASLHCAVSLRLVRRPLDDQVRAFNKENWNTQRRMASRDAFSKQAMLALYRNVLKLHRRVLPQVCR